MDLSATGGLASIRAELAPGATVGSVRLAVTGPRAIARVENTDDHAISLFGDDGRDYQAGWLPDGTYTVAATPYRYQDARRPALVAHAVTFTVTGSPAAHPPPVTGFTLVDARGGAPDPDLGPIRDGDTVDVGPAEGLVTIRADVVSDKRVGSVMLKLSGPGSVVTRAENSPGPFALFGDDLAGDYYTHWLPNGAYTLTATPYSGRDARGQAFPGLTVAFTVTGGLAADAPVVTGFTLVDARGGPPDPDLGPIVDGASVDIGSAQAQVNIRADVVSGLVGSALLVLNTGPVPARRVERGPAPFALFGDDLTGDYYPGWLPNGAYTLAVWPYSGPNARGYVLRTRTVSFTVTGGPAADASPVTGFTLVDARDSTSAPDVGPIVDGGTVDVSAVDGEVGIRADMAYEEQFRSVRLELFGPVSASRLENAPGALRAVRKQPRRRLLRGSAAKRCLPAARDTVRQAIWSRPGTAGALRCSFTVIGGIDAGESPVTGFTLVDAGGGAPDPDLGPIEDGGIVDIGPADGQVSIRVDLAHSTGIAWVRLELTGPVSMTRTERAESQSVPVSLFGDDGGGDYNAGWLADGAYTLTATPSSHYWWRGHALPARTVSFTVTGSDASASKVTGLMVVDARDGPPEPDLGLIEDGEALDLSNVGGRVNVRAEMAALAEGVGSVRFNLRGPYSRSRTENAGGLYTLFGDKDGDYYERELLDGPYTLTATPYSRSGARGDVLRPRSVAFTVTGGRAADATPVTGFTLVDARGGAPDPDIGPIGRRRHGGRLGGRRRGQHPGGRGERRADPQHAPGTDRTGVRVALGGRAGALCTVRRRRGRRLPRRTAGERRIPADGDAVQRCRRRRGPARARGVVHGGRWHRPRRVAGRRFHAGGRARWRAGRGPRPDHGRRHGGRVRDRRLGQHPGRRGEPGSGRQHTHRAERQAILVAVGERADALRAVRRQPRRRLLRRTADARLVPGEGDAVQRSRRWRRATCRARSGPSR